MSNWIRMKVGEISESCLGKMLDKDKNKGELQPYLSNKSVRWGAFDLENLSLMRFEEDETERYGLKKGDLVICEGGEPGRCAIWNGQVSQMKIQKALHRLRVKPNYSNQFLYYQFLLAGKIGDLDKYFIGSTIKHLTGINLKQIEFNFPPFQIQQKIAAVLSALDSKIELNHRINTELEAMAKTLYDYWFVQFDFPNREGKPYKTSGGKMVWSEALKRAIPNLSEWKSVSLEEIMNIFDSKRIPLSKIERQKRKGIYPYYGATTIMDYIDDYIFDGEYILLAEDGSVMDENGFPIIQFIWGKTWVNNHAHVLQSKNIENNEFLIHSLKTISVIQIMTGSIQKKINQENLMNVKIVFPDNETLTAFSNFTSPIRKRMISLNLEKQQLTALRDWLLPMLMNGQVAVS